MSPDAKQKLSKKVFDYAMTQFGMQKTVDDWHESMLNTLETWEQNYKRWEKFII